MAFLADQMEIVTGPVNGLVVKVRSPDGNVMEADALTGCQALSSLLHAPGMGSFIATCVQSRTGSDPSAVLGKLAGVASQRGLHSAMTTSVFSTSPVQASSSSVYPTGTKVLDPMGGTSVQPMGTHVQDGSTSHRYPAGSNVIGHTPRVSPPTLPPEQAQFPLAPPQPSPMPAQHPALHALFEQLGRLVADPGVTIRIQAQDGPKAEIKALIDELRS